MPQQILEVSFAFRGSVADYENFIYPKVQEFATIPGCDWKIWVVNEQRKRAGGVYLFESAEAAENFIEGPLMATLLQNPAFYHFNVKQFDILKTPSLITHAPLVITA